MWDIVQYLWLEWQGDVRPWPSGVGEEQVPEAWAKTRLGCTWGGPRTMSRRHWEEAGAGGGGMGSGWV